MITPTGDNVLIERDREDEVTKGGIVLPESSRKTDMPTAKVVAVGPKVTLVKAGDKIMCLPFASKNFGDQEIVEEKYIQAIVEEA